RDGRCEHAEDAGARDHLVEDGKGAQAEGRIGRGPRERRAGDEQRYQASENYSLLHVGPSRGGQPLCLPSGHRTDPRSEVFRGARGLYTAQRPAAGLRPETLNIAVSRPSALLPMASSMRSTVGGIRVQVRRSRNARSAGKSLEAPRPPTAWMNFEVTCSPTPVGRHLARLARGPSSAQPPPSQPAAAPASTSPAASSCTASSPTWRWTVGSAATAMFSGFTMRFFA